MAKKVRVNADQFTSNWADGMSGAGDAYQRGVESVEDAPGKKAAAQKSLWLSNLQKSADQWAKNVDIPLDEWKSAAINKGASNLATSVDTARPKVAAVAEQIIAGINEGMAAMPKRSTDWKQNYQRSIAIGEALRKKFRS